MQGDVIVKEQEMYLTTMLTSNDNTVKDDILNTKIDVMDKQYHEEPKHNPSNE